MKLIKRIIKKFIAILFSIGSARRCPICNWSGLRFMPFGRNNSRRMDSQCPKCSSLERHRFAYLVANDHLHVPDSNVLHSAPEKAIAPWLQSTARSYMSIDLYNPYTTAMMTMDLTHMDFEDGRFSLVWCSHVLEHIEDDAKAISEIYRVLCKGGKAMMQVPIYGESTFEDFTKRTPEERLKYFYQEDHVRLYGLDIVDRFKNAGFKVETVSIDQFKPKEIKFYGLLAGHTKEIFLLTK